MNRSTFLVLLSAITPLLCGCPNSPVPGSQNPPSLNLVKNKLDVSVVAPAGMPMPAQVKTSLGTVAVAGGGAPATPIFNEGPQFATATDVAGHVQLMGFVGSGAKVINTRTTAEVMLFFGLNAPLLTGGEQVQVLAMLKQLPAVETLAAAIGAALATDGMAVANRSAAVQEALTAARAEILQLPTMKSKLNAARLLIDPSDGQSGLTVTQLDLSSINIRNDFRRRAYYFLESISYVPEGGGDPVEDIRLIAQGPISPTAGATSVFSAINDIVTGTQAYAGVDSGAIETPIAPPSAESTTYLVTVVGPGAHPGDESELSQIQQEKKRQVIRESFVIDFFVPVFVDLVIPIVGDDIDLLLNSSHASDLLSGLISIVGNAGPLAIAKAETGDVSGALYDLWTNVLSDGSARLEILDALFKLLDFAGKIGADSNVDIFSDLAESAMRPLDTVDSILIGFDSLVQLRQIKTCNRAQTFEIVSDRSKVKLSPAQADIDQTQSQVLTATIPDATGLDTTIVYHWKNTALHGGIRDNQHTAAEFDSTENVVTYFPNIPVSPGVDTITVEAFEVRGQNRISLGTATATVRVRTLVPKIAPDRTSLVHNESQTFTAKVDSTLANGGALTYKWFGTTKHGHLTSPAPNLETSINTATYKASGTPPGEDTVAVEVFSTKDGVKTSLGIARAQVKIEERKTIVFGRFTVEVKPQPGQPGRSSVVGYAIVPKVEGAISYSARLYNFFDPLYYGHGTIFDDYIVRNREDRGSEFWIGLTGGVSDDQFAGESAASIASRFVGIIVEVTVTY